MKSIYRVLEVISALIAVAGFIGVIGTDADASNWIQVLLSCFALFVGGMAGAVIFEHLYFKSIKKRRYRRV